MTTATPTADPAAGASLPPLLVATNARVAIDNAPLASSLDLVTRGDRVIVSGSTSWLVALLAGAWPRDDSPETTPLGPTLSHGSMSVLGYDVARGDHRAVCGIALCDPPLPARWSVLDYLTWCARLDGASGRQASTQAAGALTRLTLGAVARRRLSTLSTLERRVVVIAGAIVSERPALVVEDPFRDLDERAGALMLTALGHASQGRATLVSLPRIRLHHPTGELAIHASDICLVRHGGVVLQHTPLELLSERKHYELTVTARAAELAEVLAERGLVLQGGPHHFALELPADISPSVVLVAASRARAPVTSCVPLIG